MSTTVNDLQTTVSAGLTTALITSKLNFGQLMLEVSVKDLYSTILYLKTNDKCRFKQLIDIRHIVIGTTGFSLINFIPCSNID